MFAALFGFECLLAPEESATLTAVHGAIATPILNGRDLSGGRIIFEFHWIRRLRLAIQPTAWLYLDIADVPTFIHSSD